MATQERAERLKLKGNECFQKGKFHAAVDMYTEAIVLDSTQTTYYSNRALSYSKLNDWSACRDDCNKALHCDRMNTKANYLLGVSNAHLLAFDESIVAFRAALSSAEKLAKSKAFQEEILVELRRAKKQQWLNAQSYQIKRHNEAKLQLEQLFQTNMKLVTAANGNAAGCTEQLDGLMVYVEQMAIQHEREFMTGDIPEYYICPVSMEIMLDPVSTPNGISYERRHLEEHLKINGAVDPLTRQRLTLDMLRPNTSLRNAIQDYLETNPWAFEH